MIEKRKRTGNLKELFNKIYSQFSLPVLFVTKTLRLYYYNAAAGIYYPGLCKPLGIKPFVKPEELENGIITKEKGSLFLLEGNSSSPYGQFIISPVCGGKKDPVCYRVQIASPQAENGKIQRRVPDLGVLSILEKRLQEPVDKLSRALQACRKSGKQEELAEKIEEGIRDLLAVQESIQKFAIEEQEWDTEERVFFSIYTLLEEISEATGFIKITKESYVEISGTSIYGRRTAIGHVLLKICRYLLLEAEEKGKITVRMKLSCGKVIINLSRKAPVSAELHPFEATINPAMGRINFGLEDARKGIEKESGNLIVKKNKNRIEVLCSIPYVSNDPSSFTLSDAKGFESFQKLESILDEVKSLYDTLPKPAKG